MRRRIGSWIAAQPADERPEIETIWRDALLVGDQVVALAQATPVAGTMPLWSVEVSLPGDGHLLSQAAGLSPRLTRRAVDVLIAAEMLDGVSQIGDDRVVRLRPEVLGDAPVLAAVRWDVVRARLGDRDAPISRLVVRELARRTSADARAQGHFVSASQRELADAAGYSKASMRRHLDALIDAGLIASRSRDRTNSWHRLQPVVFDQAVLATPALPPVDRTAPRPAPAEPRSVAPRQAQPRALPDLPRPSQRSDAIDPGGTPRPVLSAMTIEINGVRVALPAGVELTLEQDDSGAMWYRTGTVRLGPVRFG